MNIMGSAPAAPPSELYNNRSKGTFVVEHPGPQPAVHGQGKSPFEAKVAYRLTQKGTLIPRSRPRSPFHEVSAAPSCKTVSELP